jgi:hypothetical protein
MKRDGGIILVEIRMSGILDAPEAAAPNPAQRASIE